jgi:hypothetical protein
MTLKESNPEASLFSEEEMALEKVGSPVFTGASTGERLISQRPDLYRITVQLLGQGTGIREIKRLTGLHHRTIEAVMLREGLTIDTHRKELGARALKVAALGVERLEEIIAEGSIKPGELSMAVGILIDKGQVLTGGVTARVEKVEQAQVAAGLERMLDDLPVIDGEWEDASETNLGGENTQPIAALLDVDPDASVKDIALVEVDPAAGPVCEIEPAQFDIQASPSDEQSVVSEALTSVEDPIASPSASIKPKKSTPKAPKEEAKAKTAQVKSPAPASKAAGSKQGGRGFDRAAGSETATDQLSENFIAKPISQEGLDPSSETTERSKK